MKRIIFICISVFLALQLEAQNYHFNKGEKILGIGWYDSAFNEYLAGMKAGEASSAFMVAWCYINECGTPRNVQKALTILDQWSDKDLNICLYAAVFFDESKCAGSIYWAKDKVFSSKATRVFTSELYGGIYEFFGHKPQSAENFGISYNLDKAIKYAEKLNKKVNSESTQKFVNLLKTKKLEESGDFLAALSSIGKDADESTYWGILKSALGRCSTLEDISRVIDIDNTKQRVISVDNATDYDYRIRECNEILAEKCSFFYNVLLESNGGDTLLLKEDIKNEPQTRKAIDIGLSIAAIIDGYNNNDVNGVAWIINNVPFKQPNETARKVWSRCMLKTFICNRLDSYWNSDVITDKYLYDTDWGAMCKIFSSPNYVELDGHSPISEDYTTKLIDLDKRNAALKSISPESYDQQSVSFNYDLQSAYFKILDVQRDISLDNNNIKDLNWENVSTKKSDYYSIKELSAKRIVRLLSQKQTFKEMTFEQYLTKIMSGELTVNSGNLSPIIRNSTAVLSVLDSIKGDYGDAMFSTLRGKAQDQKEFAEFLSKELLKKTVINDYISFSKSSSIYCNYAKSKLANFRKKRQVKEKQIEERVGFDSKDIKKYDEFVSVCQSGVRKKIKLENVEIVKNNVIVPALKLCRDAYAIYPIDETSLQQRIFEEELAVIEIIDTYEKSNDVVTLSDSFLKQYASSSYTNLIQDYYNDSYAIRMANMLTCQSSKDDIDKVLALPMTKDGEKAVKKLTAKSYLKKKTK